MWAGFPTTARVPSTIYQRVKNPNNMLKYTPDDILIGELCHMEADRAESWSHFVIVWVSENHRCIGAIFPNVVKRDGMVRFGQDCTTWQPKTLACKCREPVQGDDFICRCGAWRNNRKLYGELFEEAPRDYEYNVVKLAIDSGWVYLCNGYEESAFNCHVHINEYRGYIAREERRLLCKCDYEARMCNKCYSGS